jgi:hypothetical protein
VMSGNNDLNSEYRGEGEGEGRRGEGRETCKQNFACLSVYGKYMCVSDQRLHNIGQTYACKGH